MFQAWLYLSNSLGQSVEGGFVLRWLHTLL